MKLSTEECKKRGLVNNFLLISKFIHNEKKLKWKCLKCGHIFYRLINNIRKTRKCPNCSPKYIPQNKTCIMCGKMFKAIHKNAKTCSFVCRNKLNYKYKKKEQFIQKCLKCGVSFKTHRKIKKYCTEACRTKDRYRKEGGCIETRIRKNLTMRIKHLTKRRDYETFSHLIGCTIGEFKTHIESKFQPGMSWDNYGKGGWHIDHIRPLSSFNVTKKDQAILANHYTNLQPLWAKDNLSKGRKWNGLDEKVK